MNVELAPPWLTQPGHPAPPGGPPQGRRDSTSARVRRLWSTAGDGRGGDALDNELSALGTFQHADLAWQPPADLDPQLADYLTASLAQLKRLVEDGVVQIAPDGSITPVDPA
jgi:hypothetical protein